MSTNGQGDHQSLKSSAGGSNRKRLTHAQALARQQEIVLAYDVEHLTFAQIARRLAMGEKEVRQAYGRYISEIAPLMNIVSADEKAGEYLRSLEEVRQELRQIASSAANDSARVGALRELVKVIFKELELRQHLGLMPSPTSDLALVVEQRWAVQQVAQLLQEIDAPAEALERLEQILSGKSES